MIGTKQLLTGLAVTTTLGLAASSAQADLLFYENFGGYTTSAIDGQGGWSSDGAFVQNGSYADGSTGIWDGTMTAVPSSGGNFYVGSAATSRTLSSTVTNSFVSGGTTWLSVVAYQGNNGSNARWSVVVGADVVTTTLFNEMNGEGLGIGQLDQGGGTKAHYWVPTGDENASDRTTSSGPGGGRPVLAVLKIDWAADGFDDTITMYRWDQNTASTPTLTDWDNATKHTLSVDLDQSTFDTLTLAGNGFGWMDDVRIATTFEDAVSGTNVVPEPGSLALLGLGGLLIARRRRG